MRNVATLPQAKHLIDLFEPLDTDQLQRLYASGLLTDILNYALKHDPITVDRHRVQCALGVDPFTFCVKMGDNRNTDHITAALDCPFDSRITQSNFPLAPDEIPWRDTIKLVDPNESFSLEEGVKFLAYEALNQPTYEHPIRFVEQFCKTTSSREKRFVVFLHAAWKDLHGQYHVMVFDRHPEVQRLALHRLTDPFNNNCVLAGVYPPM